MTLAPRPLPTDTVQGLRPPLHGYPYFAYADRLPFQPRADGPSDVNAWWLADASFLVYGSAAFVAEALDRSPLPGLGFRLSWLGTPDDNRGMILEGDDAVILAFRGTRLQVHNLLDRAEVVLLHQDDLRVDGLFLPAICERGGKVHSGFLQAFAEIAAIVDGVARSRRPGQSLWLTGHSLGGALANLTAAHLEAGAVRGLYTYGCPRVGNAAFAEAVSASVAIHERFVHGDDWVPNLPPEVLGYVHGGSLRVVNGRPERIGPAERNLASLLDAMRRWSELKPGDIPFQLPGLADHMPVYYATLLWNALVSRPDPADVAPGPPE